MSLHVATLDGQSFDIPDEEIDEWQPAEPKKIEIDGKCRVSIRFNNKGEYLKWAKYVDPQKTRWDFDVTFPAIMRREYIFHNILDVEMMIKQIVGLLQMGFDVSMANFNLEQKEVALETPPKIEDEDP